MPAAGVLPGFPLPCNHCKQIVIFYNVVFGHIFCKKDDCILEKERYRLERLLEEYLEEYLELSSYERRQLQKRG